MRVWYWLIVGLSFGSGMWGDCGWFLVDVELWCLDFECGLDFWEYCSSDCLFYWIWILVLFYCL